MTTTTSVRIKKKRFEVSSSLNESIFEKDMRRTHRPGIMKYVTEKAILFEYYDRDSDEMIEKWIPKSLVINCVYIYPLEDSLFYARSRLDKVEVGIVWLLLKDWAKEKLFNESVMDVDYPDDWDEGIPEDFGTF